MRSRRAISSRERWRSPAADALRRGALARGEAPAEYLRSLGTARLGRRSVHRSAVLISASHVSRLGCSAFLPQHAMTVCCSRWYVRRRIASGLASEVAEGAGAGHAANGRGSPVATRGATISTDAAAALRMRQLGEKLLTLRARAGRWAIRVLLGESSLSMCGSWRRMNMVSGGEGGLAPTRKRPAAGAWPQHATHTCLDASCA